MNSFKKSRTDKKLQINDVVEETCYPTYVIKAIEENKTDFLPKPYNYYCAKSYGLFLKINNLQSLLKKYK